MLTFVPRFVICTPIPNVPVITEHISAGVNHLTSRLYNIVGHSNGNVANIIMSPFSIHMCVSMLAHGSTDQTRDQLTNILGFDQTPIQDTLADNFELLWSYHIAKEQLETDIEIANSLFLDDSFSVKQDYQDILTTFYLTKVRTVNFANNIESVDTINNWVANKTRNLIQKLVNYDSVDRTTRMILLNGIYFKAKWLKPFRTEDTRTGLFHISDSNAVEASFINTVTDMNAGVIRELNNATVVSLPYEDTNFQMLLFLPGQHSNIDQLVSDMFSHGLSISNITNQLTSTTTYLSMPKFKIGYQTSLKETFKALGASRAFSKHAELGLISDESDLGVDDILHKAQVEVTEEGSEAAAVTGIFVGIRVAVKHLVVNINKPFMFIIYDSLNNIPLFVGKIGDPTDQSAPASRTPTDHSAPASGPPMGNSAPFSRTPTEQNIADIGTDQSAVNFNTSSFHVQAATNVKTDNESFELIVSEDIDNVMDAEERAHISNFGKESDAVNCGDGNVTGIDSSAIRFPCPDHEDTEPIRAYIEEHGDGSIYGHNGELAEMDVRHDIITAAREKSQSTSG
jgi:serpin B